jgi:hypothetical protein
VATDESVAYLTPQIEAAAKLGFPVVQATGRKSYAQLALDFKLLLLERHGEFRHENPEHAAATCQEIVHAYLRAISRSAAAWSRGPARAIGASWSRTWA